MRREDDVAEYAAEAREQYLNRCPKCRGLNVECSCWGEYNRALKMFEACIPRDFWDYTEDDVHSNLDAFNEVVKPYISKLNKALRGGYGLMFLGDNGVGKSMFMNLVLRAVIERGFTAYYTTLLDLDHHIKRGFNDREIQDRLDWYLTSDFVALDELGKEQFKAGDSFARTQVERILKRRFEDSRPTLIATNASLDELEKMYGATMSSILQGKYQQVAMDPGDYRAQLGARMRREMGNE